MPPSESASSESACSLVLDLAEEFLGRYRKGERPALREYTERHPELAAEIREVFPAMAVLEKIALHDESLEEAHDTALEGSESQSLQQLGDYRIIRVIGRGGMGVVYEAEQVSLGRHVALKVLPPQVRDAKQRQRFEREARAAAKLHHTNIVPVFGVGEQDGQPYYVMQFIQGLGLDVVLNELKRLIGDAPKSPTTTDTAPANDAAAALARSLVTDRLAPTPAQRRTSTPSAPAASGAASAATPSTAEEALGPSESSVSSAALSLLSTSAVFPGHGDKLATRKPTYWKSVAQIGIQIASALEYAHRQGVVHRDVKPSNLLLDTDGAVWVTDFGLAKAEGQQDLTHTGDMLGTLRYMPPEAFDGRSDARGDVYSLGLTLYELVALRRTFGEKDRHQLIKRITLGEPTRLDRLVPNLPRDLATIVHTAIAKEPARRYQTAGELAADLQRFVEDRPIQARHIGAIERTWRWSRRNPLVASLAAAVVLLLVAGTTVSTLLSINATLARHRADASAREAVEHAHKATQERNKALVEKDRADRAADIARANMYVVRLNSVQLALENSNAALALQLLNLTRQMRAAPSESMDWEWRYHWRSCHNALRILQGHEHEIGALAVHPAGARLVSGSADQTLREWDPATGQQLRSLSLGFATPCLALNAAGTRLAVGLGNGAVKILDATTWQEVHHFMAHPQAVRGLAFSPDDARLATGSEDRTVKLWNLADAQELRTFAGHSDHVSGVAFSPDGQWLASASEDFTVRLWNASTGQPRHTLHGPTAGLHCVAFSPDGRQLASAGRDWVIRTWDPDSGRELHALRAHTSEVRALAYSPDGRLLASAGADRSLKLWDLSSGRELSSLSGHQSALYSLVFSPDGRWIASGSLDQTIRLWRPNREVGSRVDKSHLNQARAVEFSPDGRWLASVGLDGRIIVRDVTTGQVKDLLGATSRGLLDLAFSPDSKRLAVAGDAGVVTLWDVAAGRPLFRAPAHTSWSSSLAFSPDGKTLASGGHDRIIKLLDAATGEVLKTLTGHRDEINGLAFSADGSRLFSGSIDTSIKIWDVDSGQPIRTVNAHSGGVTDITLSKDNRWLASCGHDRTVKIWDLDAVREPRTLTGHNDAVWRVRFIADGARLVSAGWDQTIRVWDTNTDLELTSLKGHSDRVLGLSVSPDGARLASAGGRDLTVRVWDGRPLTDATQLESEAVDLLQYLFSRPLRKADVIAYLNSAPSLRPPLRELAVELAERFRDNADAKAFHDAAWRILKHPHANATMCRFALAQMTAACELSPDDLAYRTALAAAQYRLGRFQKEFMPKAMATLNRCDSTDPRTLALVAMTQHQLDEKEQARASLGRLRLMRADPQSVGADAAALVREAESLIEGSAGQLK